MSYRICWWIQGIYLLPLVSENIELLEWWNINQSQFSILSIWQAISVTSVPSEESFSLGKNLITDKKNCLAEKTICICMCLKSW